MPDSTTPAQPAKVGDTVTYTGQDGQKHDATIESLTGDMANLSATVAGAQQKFTGVKCDPAGAPNTWDHKA